MDKELIEHITTKLQNHEESYPSGAWERFGKNENKPRGIVYWPFWAAAALILIFGGLLFTFNKKGTENAIVKTKPQIENKKDLSPQSGVIPQFKNNDELTASTNQSNASLSNKTSVADPNQKIKTDVWQKDFARIETPAKNIDDKVVNGNLLSGNLVNINLSTSKTQNFDIIAPKKKTEPKNNLTFEELLAQDTKANAFKNNGKSNGDSKWEQAIYVAPAMGNDNKVNLNYGFSLSYAVANKLSISSGVSYASISSSESLNASAPQTLSGKNLASVNAKVKGINVPLELRYKISDKLYTGIGVSALAVLDNSQDNTYLVNQVQNVVAYDASGANSMKSYIVAEKTNEPQPEEKIDPDKYIGFYNFSLGYKQKISKKNNISVEPFLRVPMKTFSKDNLNLTNGGLRLKIDF